MTTFFNYNNFYYKNNRRKHFQHLTKIQTERGLSFLTRTCKTTGRPETARQPIFTVVRGWKEKMDETKVRRDYQMPSKVTISRRLVGKNLLVIVSNVYAPNDHNEEYCNHLKDIMLDIQIVHQTLPVIMLADFNIVLED